MMKPHIGTSITFTSLGLVYIVYVTVNIVTHQNRTTTVILRNKDILCLKYKVVNTNSTNAEPLICIQSNNSLHAPTYGQKCPCIL